MKIALINPNSPFLISERVFPNIGLVRVATTLQEEGNEVDIHDFAGQPTSAIKYIPRNYDYYGFSSTTPQFPYVMKLFNTLKEENPKAKTIIGGAHASALYQLKQKGKADVNIDDLEVFDTIFAGEGEETSNIFKQGWQKGKVIKDLDSVPIPNRDLIDLMSYEYNLLGEKTTSMQTQRGCPHQCSFCSGRDIEMYNKVRMHSPERVIKEMDELNKKYGFSSFQIYDDEVNINTRRLEELCDELSKRNYQFRAFIRNDEVVKHPRQIDAMKKAGFVKLCAGIESGSDRILQILNKKSTYKINAEARRLVKKRNIHYEGFMILGHPSETLEDIKLTRKWLLDNKPDDFDLNLLTPYPGCKIYDDATPSTEFKDYRWEWKGLYFNKPIYSTEDSYYKGIDRQSKSDIRTKTLSNKDLINIRNDLDTEVRAKI